MSNRHHLSSMWQLFILISALLFCGGWQPASAQDWVGRIGSVQPNHAENPKTNVIRASSKRLDSRAKTPASKLPSSPDTRPDEKQQAIEQAIEQGNQARDKNDYERALAHYQKVSENLNPREARAFYGIGNLYADLYCHDSAIVAYRDALERKKDYLEAHIGLGYAYINKERYDDAWSEFKESQKLAPNNVEANIGLGIVYVKKKKYQEALDQINLVIHAQSIQDKDRAMAHVALGDVYTAQNKWQEAIAPYEKAISLNPDLAVAYLKLGLAQLMSAFSKFGSLPQNEVRIQDMEELSAAARKAGGTIKSAIDEHHYNHPIAYIALGYALIHQSNYQGAVGKFNTYLAKVKELENRLSSIDTNIATKCDYGFSRLNAQGYWALGFTYFRESAAEADNQRKTELLNEAIKQLEQAIHLKQDYASAYNTLGTIYLGMRKYEEAIEQDKKALLYETDESMKASIYSSIGLAYSQMGRPSEAINYLEKAIELDPKVPSSYISLSTVYKDQGNFDGAIAQLKKAMELEPETAHSYFFLASAYFGRAHAKKAEEDYAEAIRLLKKALEINNAYASAYLLLGQIYKFYKAGTLADEAIANYKKAAEYDPKNPSIYLNMADLYFAVKHNDEAAIEYLREAIKLKPDFTLAYWELGLVYQHKKDDAEAIKQMLKAIESDPKYLDAHLNLAAIYKAQKNYPEAIKHLNKATEIAHSDYYPYKELAKIYEELRKNEDAVHYYEEAMNRLDAKDSSTKNLYLGRIARLKGQYAEAIELFRKVSYPDEPGQPYFEIGVLYVVRRDKRAALEQYQQLVQLKSPLAEELLKKIQEMK